MDTYSLNARIYPVILFYLPVVFLALIFSLKFDAYIQLFVSLGVVGALSILFSQLGRDQGKIKEKGVWATWGGMPTIQLLRWRNTQLNESLKQRYHEKLRTLYSTNVLTDTQYEHDHPDEADAIYAAYTKFLISKTRDTKKYKLLFRDNISYGFRRNLWGLKPASITLIMILIIVCYSYFFWQTGMTNVRLYPIEFYLSEIMLILIMLFWIFIIKKNWIKIAAFSYAERLLETVEDL